MVPGHGITVVEEDPATGVLVAEGACDQGLVGALVVNKNKSFIAYKRLLAENYRSRSPASPGPDPRLTPLPAHTSPGTVPAQAVQCPTLRYAVHGMTFKGVSHD